MYFLWAWWCQTQRPPRAAHTLATPLVIFTFFCNNSRSVTFQHPRADNCRMLIPSASKILGCFFVQRKFCVAVLCEKKFLRVFSLYNVCNNFFRSSVGATKTSMKALSIVTKVLYVLVKSKPN